MSGEDPKIALTVPGSVLVSLLLVADRVNESFLRDGTDTEDVRRPLRDLILAIRGALRAHGWKPNPDGTWQR